MDYMQVDTVGLIKPTLDQFIGRSFAVLGQTGQGKSNTVAVAGEFHGLCKYESIESVGRSFDQPSLIDVHMGNVEEVAATVYQEGRQVIFDVSGYEDESLKVQVVEAYIEHVWRMSGRYRYPHTIILEEAQQWVPQRGSTGISSRLGEIATQGRKRGLALGIISQRSQAVNKNVLSQVSTYFLHSVSHPADLKVYYDIAPYPNKRTKQIFSRYKVGQALYMHSDVAMTVKIRRSPVELGGYTPSLSSIPDRPNRPLVEQMELFNPPQSEPANAYTD